MIDITLVESILNRNNYEIQVSEGQNFKIVKHAKGSSILKVYFLASIAAIVLGGIVLILGSVWGFVLMSPAVPLLVKVADWKKRDELSRQTTVHLTPDFLEVEKPEAIFQCPRNSVKDLGIEVERDEHVFAGSLFLDSEQNERIILLEFFGDEHNYVLDDLTKIKEFIIDKMK